MHVRDSTTCACNFSCNMPGCTVRIAHVQSVLSICVCTIPAASAHGPSITTSNADVNINLLAGGAFSVQCPQPVSSGGTSCSGPDVIVVGGQCVPAMTCSTTVPTTLPPTVAPTDASTLPPRPSVDSPVHQTYTAWYSLGSTILAPVGGHREVRAYGPGLDSMYFPGTYLCVRRSVPYTNWSMVDLFGWHRKNGLFVIWLFYVDRCPAGSDLVSADQFNRCEQQHNWIRKCGCDCYRYACVGERLCYIEHTQHTEKLFNI